MKIRFLSPTCFLFSGVVCVSFVFLVCNVEMLILGLSSVLQLLVDCTFERLRNQTNIVSASECLTEEVGSQILYIDFLITYNHV